MNEVDDTNETPTEHGSASHLPTDRSLGLPLIRMGAVSSTMDVCRRLEMLGATEGATVIAESQSQGRGRADRVWLSPAGSGLYCSILLRPHLPSYRFRSFAVAAALAICDALDPNRDAGLQFKWPNDIITQGRKLAGILITTGLTGTQVSSAILGVGINLAPDPYRPLSAISLEEAGWKRDASIEGLVNSILKELSLRYSEICNASSAAIDDWPLRLAFRGQMVTLQDGLETQAGIIEGLDPTGALILNTPHGSRVLTSGELTRGPRPV